MSHKEHHSAQASALNDLDKRILDIIQTGFPIEPRPYAVLAEQLSTPEAPVTEAEVAAHVEAMRQHKIIRRLGANFDSWKLGFRSTLCAAKVPADKMDVFVAEVNSYVNVTHNYLRKHEYNVWFTCIGPSWERVCELLDGITAKTGIPILNLPAAKLYKIRVDFKMS
ncbi:MAG: siroheme decarboxylase subunit alpha [Pseudomonadota bacterium]